MIKKEFGKDFDSAGGALTLDCCEVANDEITGKHTKTHDSGWTITGVVHEDWFYWVNYFEATHPALGVVRGDFEDVVEATSEEAFQHFYKHHTPYAWDYMDI